MKHLTCLLLVAIASVSDAYAQPVTRDIRYATAHERQVLACHKKYKSSSPLYERIRAKYPDW